MGGTTHFMRYYFFERLRAAGVGKGLATTLTFMMSAFWHGFYPGYYVAFFFGSQAVNCSRTLREWLRPKFVGKDGKTPLWYNAGGLLLTSFIMAQFVTPFLLLDLTSILTVMNSIYWLPHITFFVFYAIASQGAAATKRAAKKNEEKDQ